MAGWSLLDYSIVNIKIFICNKVKQLNKNIVNLLTDILTFLFVIK